MATLGQVILAVGVVASAVLGWMVREFVREAVRHEYPDWAPRVGHRLLRWGTRIRPDLAEVWLGEFVAARDAGSSGLVVGFAAFLGALRFRLTAMVRLLRWWIGGPRRAAEDAMLQFLVDAATRRLQKATETLLPAVTGLGRLLKEGALPALTDLQREPGALSALTQAHQEMTDARREIRAALKVLRLPIVLPLAKRIGQRRAP